MILRYQREETADDARPLNDALRRQFGTTEIVSDSDVVRPHTGALISYLARCTLSMQALISQEQG